MPLVGAVAGPLPQSASFHSEEVPPEFTDWTNVPAATGPVRRPKARTPEKADDLGEVMVGMGCEWSRSDDRLRLHPKGRIIHVKPDKDSARYRVVSGLPASSMPSASRSRIRRLPHFDHPSLSLPTG